MTTFPSIESYIESFPNTLPSIKGEPTFEDLASHVLPGECHVLIISNLENVKVCPARGML
jgi:hypothetical protein